MAENDAIRLLDPEEMREYIAHLKAARERLLDTYSDVVGHSQYIIENVWQDDVCVRFMDMLEHKQKDLYHITEVFEYNQKVMESQLEQAEAIAHQNIENG